MVSRACSEHVQGWAERPVFGKIRYMNAKGCARKFDVKAYVKRVNEMMAEVKAKLGTA